MISSMTILMVMVVPKLVDIFGDRSKLPPMTQILMNTSDLFVSSWWLMLLIFGFLFLFVLFWKETTQGKYRFDFLMLKIPVF
jgi:type II secretory pathway component PulF